MTADAASMPAFEVVMASAGTGKTFRLTNRMASLLARGVAPERILAATFTRKAAGEIRHRLLTRIAEAAESEHKAGELSRQAWCDLDSAGWLAVLRRVARGTHRLNIGTLDRIANTLARSLAPQIGLATPWQIVDEHRASQIGSEVVERLLTEFPQPEDRRAIHSLGKQEASTTGLRKLERLLTESSPRLRRLNPSAWHCLEAEANTSLTLEHAKTAYERLRRIPGPINQGNGLPNTPYVKALETLGKQLANEDVAAILTAKFVPASITDAPTYSRVPIPKDSIPLLRTILDAVVGHELRRLHQQNLTAGQLLSRAFAIDEQLRHERRAYSLDDLWSALARADLETQQISYRLDASYDHVLLDEFQDTSLDQWRVLEGLFDEAVAGGDRTRSVFVVGDAKQSLYGWRNAAPELLPSIARRWPQMTTTKLARTWRCAPSIVEAVNQVFGSLDTNPHLADHPQAARQFAERFEPHESAHPSMPAMVRTVDLATLLDPEEDDANLATARAIAQHAEELHAARPEAELAVLLRRKKYIGPIVAYLAARGVYASAEASDAPNDHPAAEAVLAVLHLAEHPSDGPSRYLLATSPLGPSLGLHHWTDRTMARRVASGIRHEAFEHGLARCVERLSALAGREANARGRARLDDLVALAERYESNWTPWSGLGDFVEYARNTRVQPRSGKTVRVMTMHAAKGLEFDIVVLADIDQPLAGRSDSLYIDADGAEVHDPTSPDSRASLAGFKELRAYSPTLASMHEQSNRRAAYDNLCLLYVGMTRARHHLEILSRADGNGTLGAVTRHGLGAINQEHVSGQSVWLRGGIQPKALTPQAPAPTWARPGQADPRNLPTNEPWRVAIVRPSGVAVRRVADTLKASVPHADLGTEVHRLLEAVEWLEDMPADPSHWVDTPGPLTEQAVEWIRRALASGPLSAALSKRVMQERWGPAVQLLVERERPIAVTIEYQGRPVLIQGRIDRLVLGSVDGRVDRCLILDFKTGTLAPDGSSQMDLYRRAMARVLGLSMDLVEGALVGGARI